MKRSGKILLEGTIEEFKKHCKGADNREYLLINTKEIKKDGAYAIYQLDSNTERVVPISNKGKHGKLPPVPYNELYLTFVALSDGTFAFSGQTQGDASNCLISYSIDNGSTWSVPSQTVEVNVQSGDKVMWKGEMNPGTYGPDQWYGIGRFNGGTAQFDIQGNMMSLLYGDNFADQTLELKAHAFRLLFTQANIVNANNLILPSTTVYCCYLNMFNGCTSLTTAPSLPATTLAQSCYSGMFRDCSSLNYIKMLATDISATNCLDYWVYGVSASGTFVKDVNTIIPSGTSGIPEGWTVEDATE